MNRTKVVCPCCTTAFQTFPAYLDHVQLAINAVSASLPVVEGHNHGICECFDCSALRKLYPEDSVIPFLVEEDLPD